MLHRRSSESSGGQQGKQGQQQEQGQTIKVTLPNGEDHSFPVETWTSMMEGIQSNCGEYFANGPQDLRSAYEQLLALAASVIHQTETQKVS